MKSCAEDSSFVVYNDNYENGYADMSRMPGNIILRGVKNIPTFQNRILTTKISSSKKRASKNMQINVSLTYKSAWKSGIFYRAYINERNPRVGATIESMADKLIMYGSRAHKDSDTASEKVKRVRIIGDLTREYRKWKIAHNL